VKVIHGLVIRLRGVLAKRKKTILGFSGVIISGIKF